MRFEKRDEEPKRFFALDILENFWKRVAQISLNITELHYGQESYLRRYATASVVTYVTKEFIYCIRAYIIPEGKESITL